MNTRRVAATKTNGIPIVVAYGDVRADAKQRASILTRVSATPICAAGRFISPRCWFARRCVSGPTCLGMIATRLALLAPLFAHPVAGEQCPAATAASREPACAAGVPGKGVLLDFRNAFKDSSDDINSFGGFPGQGSEAKCTVGNPPRAYLAGGAPLECGCGCGCQCPPSSHTEAAAAAMKMHIREAGQVFKEGISVAKLDLIVTNTTEYLPWDSLQNGRGGGGGQVDSGNRSPEGEFLTISMAPGKVTLKFELVESTSQVPYQLEDELDFCALDIVTRPPDLATAAPARITPGTYALGHRRAGGRYRRCSCR